MFSIFTRSRSRIPEIMAAGEEGTKKAIEITANNIVGIAAMKSRYKTGNMRSGWDAEEVPDGVEVAGEMVGLDFGEAGAWRVYNNVAYALYWEFGFDTGGGHFEQPMLAPAIELEEPEFERRLKNAWT